MCFPSEVTVDMSEGGVLGAKQLRALGVKVSEDGYVRTVRILPGRIDKSLIPPHIFRLLQQYNEDGEHLSKEKLRTLRNTLRRYHLIEPPNRLRWEGLPIHLRRMQRRKYNKEWYHLNKSKRGGRGRKGASSSMSTENELKSKQIEPHVRRIVRIVALQNFRTLEL